MSVSSFSAVERESAKANDEQVLGQYIPLLYHYNMLQDEDRVGAFRAAIELVVKPGMHVVELGGGTGILSSFAARQGARVSCVERNPELVSCAQQFVQTNGLAEQIDVIEADAAHYVPDHPVDVVVCEMLHVGLLREKQAQVITAFKRNYRRTYGTKLPVFVPETSILMAQPVQHSFDFAGYHAPVPMFQAPLLEQSRTIELALLSTYANIAYDESIPTTFDVHQSLVASGSGTVNAIRLITQNVLAIDMDAEKAITWPNQCLVIPIESPFETHQGENVEMKFAYQVGDSVERLTKTIRLTANSDEQRQVQTSLSHFPQSPLSSGAVGVSAPGEGNTPAL